MAKRRQPTEYGAPGVYAELIAPRYAPIGAELVEAASLRPDDDVLEVGAGTGVVTRQAAPLVRSLVATDLSPEMLATARRSIRRRPGLTFAIADYGRPLPFLERTFDVVLAGLTYVQDSQAPLRELARVLKPRGRLALAMWGRSYHEHDLLSDALESVGRGRFPRPAPKKAIGRIERAGFRSVQRRDLELENRFASVDDYLAYRRGFGVPRGWTRPAYERFLKAVRREASRDGDGGAFVLGWAITILTARL